MTEMKVTVLGYLGGFPYQNKGTSSYLLESDGYHLLLDAGSASLVALEKIIDPLTLDAVILSHYHHDHIADLGVLQYYRQLMPHGKQQVPILPIYGHTEDPFHFNDLSMKGISQGYPYKEGDCLTIGPFEITFMRTIHPVPCFAMRFKEKKSGKIFVFTGDSGYLESFKEFARAADVFMADTYLFEGNEKHHAHFTSKESGEIAYAADVKKLVLTHLPQTGDLQLLKIQAEEASQHQIPVVLANTHLVLEI